MSEFTTTELFRQAKEQLDIRRCAEHYGLTLDRHGKALCPFHNDRHPSMSFKGKYFKCFSCGEGGDVFKLVGQLTGITKPIDVLKMLNEEYGLGLPIGVKMTREQFVELAKRQSEERRQTELRQQFEQWWSYAFRVFTEYVKILKEWEVEYAPRSSIEEFHPRFLESLHNLSMYEHISLIMIRASQAEKESFYLLYGKEVDDLEQKIREYRDERISPTIRFKNCDGDNL